jgi:hypothetical protein
MLRIVARVLIAPGAAGGPTRERLSGRHTSGPTKPLAQRHWPNQNVSELRGKKLDTGRHGKQPKPIFSRDAIQTKNNFNDLIC